MKLLYATSITLPSYRANRIQVAAMARAWAKLLGGNFILGVSIGAEELKLPAQNIFTVGEGRAPVLAWRYLRFARAQGASHIYCREELMLASMLVLNTLLFRLPVRFYYELHHLAYARGVWRHLLLNRVAGIVSITHGMKDLLVKGAYPAGCVLVAPDAVDTDAFDPQASKEEARRELGLPLDKKILLYTGDIFIPWKGAGVLHEAAGEFDNAHLFVFVGSKPHHVEYFRSTHPERSNVLFAGYQPHERIPRYLAAADVLVLPNSAQDEVSRISTSPMKLFEYMASGRPIVASNIPSIREIVDEQSAALVRPDDSAALAGGIRAVLEDAGLAERLAAAARKKVIIHTWERRAGAITDFINHA
jgi:glycosyltransferase involved in cell wall biosynthesis